MESSSCPISYERVNESAVRVGAGLIIVVTASTTVMSWPLSTVVFLVLAADFCLRATGWPGFSPIGRISTSIVRWLGLPTRSVDAAPKRFAAGLGCVFAILAALLHGLGVPLAGHIVAVALMAFAFLESALGYCVGCRVWQLLPRSNGT